MIAQDEWTQPDPSLYPIIARLDPDAVDWDPWPVLPRRQATGWTFVQLAPGEPGYLFPTYVGAGSPCTGGPQNRRPEPGVIPGVLDCRENDDKLSGRYWWWLWQESEIDWRIDPWSAGVTHASLLALVREKVERTDGYHVLSEAGIEAVVRTATLMQQRKLEREMAMSETTRQTRAAIRELLLEQRDLTTTQLKDELGGRVRINTGFPGHVTAVRKELGIDGRRAVNGTRPSERPARDEPHAADIETPDSPEPGDVEKPDQDLHTPTGARIVVTNYERLERFDQADFSALVCDESSILKNFGGERRKLITELMRRLPYRLLCTATAAPNDYVELGTSSEALGELGYMDMLGRFFRNDNRNTAGRRYFGKAVQWRFKGHAEAPFWRWVTSWARAIRRPSDLGYPDDGFVLPELLEHEHIQAADRPRDGMLFDLPATTLAEQREERRRTIASRCATVAELASHDDQALVWCNLNDEGALLADMIPGAVEVQGSDSDEAKEERLLAFAHGEVRALVTKPTIGAWGLNLQRCAHVTYFPTHSYEQYYQAVRRCWRFGQTRPVTVDIVATEGERRVIENLRRKAAQADRMFAALVERVDGLERGYVVPGGSDG